MRWGWLLPDPSYQVLYDGWERQSYRPRHGRPPFVIRGAYSAAMVVTRARERYLGVADDGYALPSGAAQAGPRAGALGVRTMTGTGSRPAASAAPAAVSPASIGAAPGHPRSAG